MDLMKNFNATISEIPQAVEFSNLRTFHRAFNKLTDLTPSQSRKKVRPPSSSQKSVVILPKTVANHQ